jgi:hypothetical protein
MLNSKCLPNDIPSTVVHEILTAHGFKKIGNEEHQIYQAKFKDTTTQIKYYFYITTRINKHEEDKVSFDKVYFDRSKSIPFAVLEGAEGKLLEISDYLNHVKCSPRKKNRIALRRGYMVRDYKELKKLGEEMNKMPTNTEVQKGGQVPDPIQHDLP